MSIAAFAVAAVATFFQFRAMNSQLSVMQKSIDLGLQTLKIMDRQLKSQVSSDLTSKLNGYNQVEMAYPDLDEFYSNSPSLNHKVRHVGSLLTDMRFAVYEEAFVQHHVHGFMDRAGWKVWQRLIQHWIEKPFFVSYWHEGKGFFNESFSRFVDELMSKEEIDS